MLFWYSFDIRYPKPDFSVQWNVWMIAGVIYGADDIKTALTLLLKAAINKMDVEDELKMMYSHFNLSTRTGRGRGAPHSLKLFKQHCAEVNRLLFSIGDAWKPTNDSTPKLSTILQKIGQNF